MRRSFPELERSLILKSRQLFPRGVCKYNEMTHRWSVRPTNGGADSFIDFGYARNRKEAEELYKSAEFTFLGIDEATLLDWETITFLMSRSRTSIKGSKPRIVMCSNPGGVGHFWAKQYFGIGNPLYPPETTFIPPATEEDPEPLSRCFIPAKLSDNPALIDNDPKYRQKLMLLPPAQRKMLLEGDWDTIEGRFFVEFTNKHVIAPDTVLDNQGQMPRHWKYYRSVDYGYSDPFCCLWFGVAPDGHIYCYRELYAKGLRDKEQAELIRSHSYEPIEYTTCDPSMKNVNASGVSPYENYVSTAGIVMVPSARDRIMGWMACRNMLAMHSDGTPILRFFSTCAKTIGEINNAVHDESGKRIDDINIHSRRDHALDSWRYYAVSRPFIPLEPTEDPYAHLDAASRREWIAVNKKQNAIRDGSAPDAVLRDINAAEEGNPWD